MSDREGGAPADETNAQVTRRDAVMAATGTLGILGASLAGSPSQSTAATAASYAAPNSVPTRMMVNGRSQDLNLDPRSSLLDVLREQLGLTGCKKGCDHGQCGACTVHVDGRRVASCLTLAVQADGREVTTIEGL